MRNNTTVYYTENGGFLKGNFVHYVLCIHVYLGLERGRKTKTDHLTIARLYWNIRKLPYFNQNEPGGLKGTKNKTKTIGPIKTIRFTEDHRRKYCGVFLFRFPETCRVANCVIFKMNMKMRQQKTKNDYSEKPQFRIRRNKRPQPVFILTFAENRQYKLYFVYKNFIKANQNFDGINR